MLKTCKNSDFLISCLLLFILCIAAHADNLGHSFMLDDSFFLNDKETLKIYPHVMDFFTKNQSIHYVPFNFLCNVYLFHFIKHPFFLYLLNIVSLYIDSLLLFIFAFLISQRTTVSLLTGIIFCIHPLSAEIIQHITFNIILIQFGFIMASLILLYKYSQEKEPRPVLYAASFLTFLGALLCQENSLLCPLYVIFLFLFLTDTPLRKTVTRTAPFILSSLLYLILWLLLAGTNSHLIGNIQSFHLTFWVWSANFARLVVWYIQNLFIPQSIVFEYNLSPIGHHAILWNLILGAALTGYLLLITHYFKKSVESFALIIFITGFIYAIPASLAHPETGLVLEAHWLYFSLSGFCLFAALMLEKLRQLIPRLTYSALLTIVLMALLVCTVNLHVAARNELSYCENWLRKSPHNAYAISLLAKDYAFNKNTPIPADLISDMFPGVDYLIDNNYYISAPKLIEKLSSCPLSPAQRWALLLKSAGYHCKYGNRQECNKIIGTIIRSLKQHETKNL